MVDLEKNPFVWKPHPYERSGGGNLNKEWFQGEMEDMKQHSQDPHWLTIDPQELTDWDNRTWMWFRAGTLTPAQLKLRRDVAARENPNPSRESFYSFVGNELDEKEAMREAVVLEEIEEVPTQ